MISGDNKSSKGFLELIPCSLKTLFQMELSLSKDLKIHIFIQNAAMYQDAKSLALA
jgi:hypothetical protein